MWDLRLGDGIFAVEFDSSGTTEHTLANTTPVNDGNWHSVTLQRVGETMTLAIDGSVEATDTVPAAEGVTNTAPILVGDGDPCIGIDGTVPFVGAIDDLYIGPGPLVDFAVSQPDPIPVVPAGGSGVLDVELSGDQPVSDHMGNIALTAPAGITFTNLPAELTGAGCSIMDAGTRIFCDIGPYNPGVFSIPFDVDPSATPGETLTGAMGFTNQETPDPNLANSQIIPGTDTFIPFSIQVASEVEIPLVNPFVAVPLLGAVLGAVILVGRRARTTITGT